MENYLRELGREIGEIKGKLDQLLDVIPLMDAHTEKITRMEESLKSAHKRIDAACSDIGNMEGQITKQQEYVNQVKGVVIALCALSGIAGFILSTLVRVMWK